MRIMKKPKYITQMYSFIFFFIGVAFIISGLLVAWGIMSPSKHSAVQDKNTMTLIFCMISLGFFIASSILISISCLIEKKRRELISNGKLVAGTVDDIRYKRWISFGKISPYVIYFSFSFDDKIYHGKSYLVWEKPNFADGDSIEIYVNDFGNSTVMI